MASCLLVPCAFLVLGATLLDGLFEGAINTTYWICFMALMCLPACLISTLKEEAGAVFAGCVGTLSADSIDVVVVMYGMAVHPSPPIPDIKISQVARVFPALFVMAYFFMQSAPSP
ncbi:Amino Acid/Auxin Permease [Phytophthora megakarya]|uniref:Amino Acid/Auxin Permease n=1 Tax=Phytophthora megakarya TaxID=4795 RepID=A0A225V8T8_9STRA|nr:Amino Acid/Auxin Permease [Phytophthora megakarya]